MFGLFGAQAMLEALKESHALPGVEIWFVQAMTCIVASGRTRHVRSNPQGLPGQAIRGHTSGHNHTPCQTRSQTLAMGARPMSEVDNFLSFTVTEVMDLLPDDGPHQQVALA